jgi:Tol biopolymer transport system component
VTIPAETSPGLVLGTAGYMSPEQVRGQRADHRSDIFALGTVLYEMLSGHRAFVGNSSAETLAAIAQHEPPALPARERQIPPALVRIVNRCLEKSPASRFKSGDDLAFALETVFENTGAERSLPEAPPRPRRERLAWAVAATLLVLLAAVIGLWLQARARPAPPARELRVEINTAPTTDPVSLALAPDGQKVVFQGIHEGGPRLWLRALNASTAQPLHGTEFGVHPFWSPDSRSVGFFADGKLKRIDIENGTVEILTSAPAPRGGTWNRNGTILFAQLSGGIQRVADRGGDPAAVTHLELPRQSSHRFPQFLPDGEHFLYYVIGVPDARGVYVGRLGGSTSRLTAGDASAVYSPTGHLFSVRQGTLFAQAFDVRRLALTGDPFPVAAGTGIPVAGAEMVPALSASEHAIVYRSGASTAERQFVWFDRAGKELGRVGSPVSALNPNLSPDERTVAMYRMLSGNTDIWLLDLLRGVFTRFTFDAANDVNAIWSPDGARIVFQSNRKGVSNLYQRRISGGAAEEELFVSDQDKAPLDWTSDGRFVLFRNTDPKMGYDLWALPFEGPRTPFPVVQSNFEERDGQFSPDGQWIAYQSNESGRVEVYVQPFPNGRKWQISTAGGAQVRWGPGGKELFYIAFDGRLMAVSLRLAADRQTVDAAAPVPLFATRVGGAVQGIARQQYAVSADGKRFLMNTLVEDASTAPISVIFNWQPR